MKAIISAIGLATVSALRLAVLNDLHLNMNYSASCGFPLCLDLGTYGLESSPKLLDVMLEDMHTSYQDLDAVLITGDFVLHGLSSNVPGVTHWPEMKSIIKYAIDTIQEKFPGVPILSNVGNNDLLYHYKPPTSEEKAMYYGDLLQIWFDDVEANTNDTENYKLAYETFREGGYYSWDMTDDVTILSFNSIYTNFKSSGDDQEQFDWLEEQLSSDNGRKYILQMHIPPGQWYYNRDESFWTPSSLSKYLELFTQYQDKILILLGAHVHSGEIRAPLSSEFGELLNLTVMMTPGMSPIYNNNPGYTILDISKDSNDQYTLDATWRFLQLQEYLLVHFPTFITNDPETLYGISLTDASSIRKHTALIQNDSNEYGKYLISRMGFRDILAQAGSFAYMFLKTWIEVYDQKHFVCTMLNYEAAAYQACIKA